MTDSGAQARHPHRQPIPKANTHADDDDGFMIDVKPNRPPTWLHGVRCSCFRLANHMGRASGRRQIAGDLEVVEVAFADGAAQGPDDAIGVIVRSLDVHWLAFASEGDIATSLPRAEMARASGEIRMRFKAKLTRIPHGAENHMPRQLDWRGQRGLIVRPEEPVRESRQLAPVHRLGPERVLHTPGPDVNQVAADGYAAAPVPGDQSGHQTGLAGLRRGTDTWPLGMPSHGQPGSPVLVHPAANERGFLIRLSHRDRPDQRGNRRGRKTEGPGDLLRRAAAPRSSRTRSIISGFVQSGILSRITRRVVSGVPDPEEEGGRGLFLVAVLSARWDWYPTQEPVGKVIWCRIEAGMPKRSHGPEVVSEQ